jgi:hypothetical protein
VIDGPTIPINKMPTGSAFENHKDLKTFTGTMTQTMTRGVALPQKIMINFRVSD